MSRRTSSKTPAQVPANRVVTVIYSLAALLALAGLADAVYLTVLHLTGQSAVCGASAGCSQVLGSKYAQVGPVPVALLGVIGYFSVFSFTVLAACGYLWAYRPAAVIVGLMFLATLWFLYVQAFVLHQYCRYCLLSAAVTVFLAGLLLATTPPARE